MSTDTQQPDGVELPPQDLHAEQATLGGMLVEPGAATRALAAVSAPDFYREAHRTIFEAIAAVHERNEPADILTVSAELRNANNLDAVGGPAYLTTLIRETPTAAHVVRYAKIVKEKGALRKLITVAANLRSIAFANPPDVDEALHQAESLVFDVRRAWDGEVSVSGGPIADVVAMHGRAILEEWENPEGVRGPQFGIRALDEDLLGGLPRPGMAGIMAETSYGKTALSCQLARTTAQLGMDVVFFDLETAEKFILRKFVQQITGIDAHWRRLHGASQEQLDAATDALETLRQLPLDIESLKGADLPNVRARILDKQREKPRDLYVVDFLQQIAVPGARDEWDGLRTAVRQLQRLARDLDTTIVAGSQVSLTARGDYRAFGVSVLQQAVDVELIIRKYTPKSRSDVDAIDAGQVERASPLARLSVAKYRQGSTGSVPCVWDPSHQVFFGLQEAGRYVSDLSKWRSDFRPEDWAKIEAGKHDAVPAKWTGLR